MYHIYKPYTVLTDAMHTVLLLLLFVVSPIVLVVAPAAAQYMYLDSNGDGLNTSADTLKAGAVTLAHLWLRTDVNRDGSSVVCIETAMTLNSYEVVLKANGGTVRWLSFTNNMTQMTTTFGSASDSVNYYIGFGGGTQLGAGTYNLGTLKLQVDTGRPSISIASSSALGSTYQTAFGSACGGSAGNNTLTLGLEWADADGLGAPAFGVAYRYNFESGSLPPNWAAADYNTSSGYDSWYVRTYPCLDAYEGSFSVSASGDGDQPCGYYDNNQSSWLWTAQAVDMSQYTSYYLSFSANFSLGAGDQFKIYVFDYGDDTWTEELSYTGTSGGGWTTYATALLYNTLHERDNLAFAFVLLTDNSGVTAGRCYVDYVQVYGQPRATPNLVAYTPSGWSGPIVPSYRTGTTQVETLTAGGTSYIDWAIKNVGTATANSFYVYYYLDNAMLTYDYVGSLVAGSEHKLLDYGTTVNASGNHTLKIVIDPENNVAESNEADNTFQYTFFWNAPGSPDLFVPQPISVDNANPSLGDNITITVKVRNGGNASTVSGFTVGLYKNRTSPPTTADSPDFTNALGALVPGGEVTTTFTVSSGLAGTWQTYVLLDSPGSIGESLESNNVGGPVGIIWRAGVFTVRGAFLYDDSLNGNAATGIPCSVVEVWHDDVVDSLLATGVVGDGGLYQIGPITNLDATPPAGGNAILDIYVKWKYESWEPCWNASYPTRPIVTMKVGESESRWSFNTETISDMANTTYNFGVKKPTSYDKRSAAHIFDRVLRAWQYFGHTWRSNYGSPGPVNVRWLPGSGAGSSYVDADTTIRIAGVEDAAAGTPKEWNRFAIAHEYGHHLNHRLGQFAYSNSDSVAQHTWDGPCISLQQAWDESIADLVGFDRGISGSIYSGFGRDPNGTVRQTVQVHLEPGEVVFYDASGNPSPPISRNAAGPRHELCVTSMLWDVQDNAPDNPDGDVFGDSLWGGWGTIYEEVLRFSVGSIHTACDFEKYYLSLWGANPDYRLDAQNVFREHALFCNASSIPTGVQAEGVAPELILYGGTPNPFNPSTRIRFSVPPSVGNELTLTVYNTSGRRVRTLFHGAKSQGVYDAEWDGTTDSGMQVASGVYFINLTWGGQRRTERVTLLR